MTFGEADESSFMHNVGATEATSFKVMERALELGITFWDTANIYGQDGLSEKIIGNWFASSGKRDEVILATKFRFRMHDGPNGAGASRGHIMNAIEGSLRRLQTDRIDLYQIHMQDSSVAEEETLRALDDLVKQGKVRYIGLSNYTAYRMVESLWTSKSLSLEPFVAAQMQYSLLCRDIEREHIPYAKKCGLGILPWSPLASGFLSGKYRENDEPPAGSRLATWSDRRKAFDTSQNWAIIEVVRAVAKEIDATPSAVALAWLLSKPIVSSVIIGARTIAQLEENAAAVTLTIPDALLQRLEEVSKPHIGYPYDFIARVEG